MAYTRLPVSTKRKRTMARARPRFRAGLPVLGDDAGTCLDNCDATSGPTGSSPDPVAYATCNSTCGSLYPSTPSTTTSTSTSTSTPSSSSSGSSSIWGNIGAAAGGVASSLLRPATAIMPAGIDPTTLLLLGGGLIVVVMMTRKRD
jgi:hypothetical protein